MSLAGASSVLDGGRDRLSTGQWPSAKHGDFGAVVAGEPYCYSGPRAIFWSPGVQITSHTDISLHCSHVSKFNDILWALVETLA